MIVFRSSADIPVVGKGALGPSAVTIGNFDGVHAGHRQIMRRTVALARERGLTPVALTFDPHPAQILAPHRAPKLLMTIAQRLRALESEGIEAVFLLPFSLEFARQTPEQFAAEILRNRLHARVVLVGEDFRFGCKQSGTVATLRELGAQMNFEVEPIAPILRHGERISSSVVRSLVEQGNVSRACRLLGAPFTLDGKIVSGHGIGSRQTVPTLNLAAENEVLPAHGVYVTRTRDLEGHNQEKPRSWRSLTNVGVRPTFNGDSLTVETFLLDPLGDPDPARIELSFLSYIRPEVRFNTPADLKTQIGKDIAIANRLHRRLAKHGV